MNGSNDHANGEGDTSKKRKSNILSFNDLAAFTKAVESTTKFDLDFATVMNFQ